MVLNGTTYKDEIPADVMNALEWARLNGERMRFWYGDANTGRAWDEENDVVGHIGRSNGIQKVPLLIANKKSSGGGALLDHCIVALRSKNTWWYRHPLFVMPVYTKTQDALPDGYLCGVDRDGVRIANFKAVSQADRWIAFMIGERFGK